MFDRFCFIIFVICLQFENFNYNVKYSGENMIIDSIILNKCNNW